VNTLAALDRGREAYARQAWMDAYDCLSAADRSGDLGAADLELLATAAYMVGHEGDYLALLERGHRAHLDAGETMAAVRCAFWVGVTLAREGEMGRAGGWLARAQRLLERVEGERVEHGYMLLPLVFQQEASGDWDAAAETAGEAASIGERFGDADLFALAAQVRGHILIQNGHLTDGLGLLDEAMVAVTARELSPIVSGIVYCGVILACQEAYEVRRAKEWTAALSAWCERQPDLVAFTGRCLVHRAEILQLEGTWAAALDEARRACERCLAGENKGAAGEACYRQGEIQRALGHFDEAERAYREASRLGREPQPGLALLRLAQGNNGAAEAAIRRVAAETSEPGRRAGVLPAFVEIMLAVGDLDAARDACAELATLAADHAHGVLGAAAAQARGTVEMAAGNPDAALSDLRHAVRVWRELGAPYEAARARTIVGQAFQALGDEDTASLEIEAARAAFSELGAAADLARLERISAGAASTNAHGLSERELEVLRHLAAGVTNKEIAAALVLSVRTVDRHVSNIFVKLGVSTRAAATAYAHEHGVV
jgi:DNA-binding CsgD family transcriptional regulator